MDIISAVLLASYMAELPLHPYVPHCCCRFFQELDFPWSLDVEGVLQLIPKVIHIVAEEASRWVD